MANSMLNESDMDTIADTVAVDVDIGLQAVNESMSGSHDQQTIRAIISAVSDVLVHRISTELGSLFSEDGT